MYQPAKDLSSSSKNQTKATRTKMATQVLLFYQTKKKILNERLRLLSSNLTIIDQ